MRSLKLTQDHKDKLLEMANTLFPEYNFTFYHTISEANMLVGFLKTNDSDVYDNCDIFIHWFEFCFTKLINELAWKNIKTDILADCEYESARLKYLLELAKDRPSPGQYHPVDYLYQELLKLK